MGARKGKGPTAEALELNVAGELDGADGEQRAEAPAQRRGRGLHLLRQRGS